MQIVIEIDENVYTRLFDNGIEDYAIVTDDLFAIAKSIRKGTPLPKGHGRIVDVDKLMNELETQYVIDDGYIELNIEKYIDEEAEIIIDADKE